MVEPTNAEAYYNRGLCKELMKKYAEAQEDYQQALVFDAKNKNTKEAIQRIQHFIKK
jgi:tetratricopeptide (TPR) repeat protein